MEICDRCREEPEIALELCYNCGEALCERCWGDRTVSVCSKCDRELDGQVEGRVFAHPMMKLFDGSPLTVLFKRFPTKGAPIILGLNHRLVRTWNDRNGNCAAYVIFGITVFDFLIALARKPMPTNQEGPEGNP